MLSRNFASRGPEAKIKEVFYKTAAAAAQELKQNGTNIGKN